MPSLMANFLCWCTHSAQTKIKLYWSVACGLLLLFYEYLYCYSAIARSITSSVFTLHDQNYWTGLVFILHRMHDNVFRYFSLLCFTTVVLFYIRQVFNCSAWSRSKSKPKFGPKRNTKFTLEPPPPTHHHHRKLLRHFQATQEGEIQHGSSF